MDDNENIAQLLKWAFSVLKIESLGKCKSDIVVQTPWSIVIRIKNNQNCYYLKQTPPDLYIEAEIINIIQNNMLDPLTPTILYKNHKLNCFVMNSCGDHSLRTKFNGTIDEKLLIDGLHSYIKIQRALEQDLDDFLKVGVPDWRIQQLPDLYIDLLEKREMLLTERVTSDEIEQLKQLVPNIKSICQFLSKGRIQETLVNCDFNENNMIMNEDTDQISIIDWGESVISHPFFSIASHLQSIARRYHLELDGQLLGTIKQKCLSCWSSDANKDELNEIYQNILRLHPIFSSLSIHRLQAATHDASKEMQRWFIGKTLRTLLKNERELKNAG